MKSKTHVLVIEHSKADNFYYFIVKEFQYFCLKKIFDYKSCVNTIIDHYDFDFNMVELWWYREGFKEDILIDIIENNTTCLFNLKSKNKFKKRLAELSSKNMIRIEYFKH